MMSADKTPAKPDEGHSSGGRKTSPSMRPPEQSPKCPRCDSPNTKFCYYNNYSLTQPRHFCKTCRRYWTKGGALRNVPIGGGCRKNKKVLKSSRIPGGDSKDSGESAGIGGFKFFNGLSPAMDFQLGGLNFPRLHQSSSTTGVYNYNQFSTPGLGLDYASGSTNSGALMGFNFPLKQDQIGGFNGGVGVVQDMNVHNSNIASSIESLSSINQDLHWKLQQQRLAMLFGSRENQKPDQTIVPLENQAQKPQPILFQNLEISKPDSVHAHGGGGGDSRTEWFFDNNSYAPVNPTPADSGSTGNEMNTSNWDSGIQGWSTNLNQYSPLP